MFSYHECAINRGGRSSLVYVLEDDVLRSPLLMRDGRRNNGKRGNGEKVHGIFIEIWEKMFEIEVFFFLLKWISLSFSSFEVWPIFTSIGNITNEEKSYNWPFRKSSIEKSYLPKKSSMKTIYIILCGNSFPLFSV